MLFMCSHINTTYTSLMGIRFPIRVPMIGKNITKETSRYTKVALDP